MCTVLITLMALMAGCLAATLSGVVDRRTATGLTSSCRRVVSKFFSAFTGLARNPVGKVLAGKSGRSGSVEEFVAQISCGKSTKPSPDLYAPLDMNILNSHVLMTEVEDGDSAWQAFGLEICGTIHAPGEMRRATMVISVSDVTGGVGAEPVLAANSRTASPSRADAPEFRHIAELGRLPSQVTRLENWTAVARLRTDGQLLPRQGKRTLEFRTSIVSAEGGNELAGSRCKLVYENPAPGYLDLEENAERARVLTVALAFAVSAADNRLYDSEVELIKRWARENVLDGAESDSVQSCARLEQALSNTIAFFTEGNKLDTSRLCTELVEIAAIGQRYEVLDLCLRVAAANGSVTAEEMAMVKDLASQLEIDSAKFRTMIEKILPVGMHKVMGVDDILGISGDMSSEKTRLHLNREYSKWNSRVTNTDPEIQAKADQMLKLIAEARGRYVTSGSNRQAGPAQR